MLVNKEAIATIAVKQLEPARKFYEGTLGLKPAGAQEPGVVMYQSGKSRVLVYESQYAGTNQATVANWVVPDDLEGVVKALKAKGVAFEHYDVPGVTRKGEVHVAGHSKVAWFKDPDGNILALISE